MNTSALKAFAPAVRKQLIEAVSRKLDFALAARTPDYLDTYATQVRSLRELATEDRKGLIERVAYTWFNRLAALRYLDARNWHPFHLKVLMAASAADTLPELFTVARLGAVPVELRRYIDTARMEALLQGRIPSADPQGEVYRLMVLAACRFYNEILPDVFERLDDETELLLPDDLLTEQSVAQGFRTEIADEDCEQVEVLGWLYQFYISEKKDEVMKRKAAVPAEDIPAVTQLFTPHWIVRYLVENSLGRLWLLNRPESLLKAWMPYYIESAEPEAEFIRIESPQDIRLCDPAAGSGHMLTYAFDLLYVIYEEEGYAPSEIPAMILRHNLTGIEIDARAAQLAALAMTLKARERSPRFFQQQYFVRPNIVELRDIDLAEGELLGYSEALGLDGLFTPPILKLMHQFEEAKNFGSLIQPCVGGTDVAFARGSVEARDLGSNLFLNETHKKVLRVLEQAEALSKRYHVIVANPPYMGSSAMNPSLRCLVDSCFPAYKADLFAVFVERGLLLGLNSAILGFMSPFVWMFVSSFKELRVRLTTTARLSSLIQLEYSGFSGATVPICCFVVMNQTARGEAAFIRLASFRGPLLQGPKALEAIQNNRCGWFYRVDPSRFASIDGRPFCFWAGDQVFRAFRTGRRLDSIAATRKGMASGNNARFVRQWFEVSLSSVGLGLDREAAKASSFRWFPYSNGGAFRKWYGNDLEVVDWQDDGLRLQSERHESGRIRAVNLNLEFIFRPGVSWTSITSSSQSYRLMPQGMLFSSAANSMFLNDQSGLEAILAFLNSHVAEHLSKCLNPTLNANPGDVSRLPILDNVLKDSRIRQISMEALTLARADWDSSEVSWDFSSSPILAGRSPSSTVESAWTRWRDDKGQALQQMRSIETENNKLFINAYGLEKELSSDTPEDQITLMRADRRRDMASLISYSVGCIMGRYSLDRPGVILGNVGDGLAEYIEAVGRDLDELTLVPNREGTIPVLDEEWFADDIVARTREFLKVTFGEPALRDNIRFIEESLGRDLRSYFLTDFYKDHLQTYKKRPIYWMVQSPRRGFSVLIYLHRYTRDTMNIILNRYLREFQVKLRSKIEHLQRVRDSASASNREKAAVVKELTKLTKTLHECEEWERQTILPLAQARIELDLDDGVKVNYLKLGEALAPIPGLAAAEE